MPKRPLSPRVAAEYGRGIHYTQPLTTYRSRATTPSFADSAYTITNIEQVAIPVVVGAIGVNGTVQVSNTVFMQAITGVNVNSYDLAQIMFANVQITGAPASLIIGHPSLTILSGSNQVQPSTGGVLAPGTNYSQMRVQVSFNLHAVSAYAGGTLTVNATALLCGTPTGDY